MSHACRPWSLSRIGIGIGLGTGILFLGGCEALRPTAETARTQGPVMEAAADESPMTDFMSRAQSHIAEREYWASRSGEGLQAPNRAHGLRTFFDARGIETRDRTAGGSPALVGLSWVGLGRGGALQMPPPGELSSEGARIEIARPGSIEWYLNSPTGLEQGFTLLERPEGEGDLRLAIAVAHARATPRSDEIVFTTPAGRRIAYGALSVVDAGGRTLAAHLAVPDPNRIEIVVDDEGAAYPIVVDPLLTETDDARVEGDQASARLGASVAAAGDVNGDGYADVIVGAPFFDAGQTNEGATFIFLGSASGLVDVGSGGAAAQLESDQADARLGGSVAGAGDVNGDGYDDVIVGAYLYDAGQSNEGIALVFLGSAAGIADGSPANATAQLESNQVGAGFGESVASAGDVNGDGHADVIVGARSYDAGQTDEGAAFVFLGSASGIADGDPTTAATQIQSNQASAFLGSDFSGSGVASAGDVNGDGYDDVIVGSRAYDAGQANEGAAFLFLGSATGIADGNPANAATQLEGDQADAAFGGSVASAGDVNGDGYADVIVGSRGYDAGQTDEGAAFLFLGSETGIADANPATAATQLESNFVLAQFGYSVSGAGDMNADGYADVVVGAPFFAQGETNEGGAFVYFGSASGIASGGRETAVARLQSDQTGAQLGTSVAIAGDVNGDGYSDLIVGADAFDAGQQDEGAAFVYHGGGLGIGDGTPVTAATVLESDRTFQFPSSGGAVSAAGDVNRDGYADVILGVPAWDGGETDEGAVFVFAGGPSGIASGSFTSAVTQIESNKVDAYFGYSVAAAGDVNGDGYGDIIVGAPFWWLNLSPEGAAFIFHGSAFGIPSGSLTNAATRLRSDQYASIFGWSVDGAGDVNGDGFSDVVVGAPYFEEGVNGAPGENVEGGVFLFHGAASGIPDADITGAATVIQSNEEDARLGWRVAHAGDVNGDGLADVMAGAPNHSGGQSNEGGVFVFHGGPSGIASGDLAAAAATIESDRVDESLGFVLDAAGDVNGDGFADLIVGLSRWDAGETNEGGAFIFHGSSTGIIGASLDEAATAIESNQASAFLGSAVGGAGDVNGDGYSDVIVGADGYDAGQLDEGAAFVFAGGPSGIANGNPATAAAQLESDQAGAEFGFPEARGIGDVNGDGFADIAVMARQYSAGQTAEGAAFFFLGNGGQDARPVRPQQLVAYEQSSRALEPWGSAVDETSFRVRMSATHPQGHGRVKLEVEVCPSGTPFGDVGCERHVGADWVGTPPNRPIPRLTETITGLTPDTLYRWRARVLHAPLHVTSVTSPPNPAHGPWRRPTAQNVEADVRTSAVPEPGLGAAIAGGVAAIAIGARARRRGARV